MKVLFVGTGSIAIRHIKNLVRINANVEIDAVHHTDSYNCQSDIDVYIQKHYIRYDSVPDDYDIIFVTNPTSEHFDTLMRLHNKGRHFFIEKPVFSSVNTDVGKLNLRKDSVYYVACPLRYTKILQYIKNNIDFHDIYSVRSISSSYLPDWRPGIDYRKTYSAKKELGGGVSLDLIHEWDYLRWMFGDPCRMVALKGKKSNLEINSNDIAIYVAEYKDKLLELHLDYFGRKPIRKLTLFGENDTIEADMLSQSIRFLREDRVIHLIEDRDEYQRREILSFFEMVQGKLDNWNTIDDAMKTLSLAIGNDE